MGVGWSVGAWLWVWVWLVWVWVCVVGGTVGVGVCVGVLGGSVGVGVGVCVACIIVSVGVCGGWEHGCVCGCGVLVCVVGGSVRKRSHAAQEPAVAPQDASRRNNNCSRGAMLHRNQLSLHQMSLHKRLCQAIISNARTIELKETTFLSRKVTVV